MPDIIKNSGLNNQKYFAYVRYDYDSKATERNSSVKFDVPAGWHKVATMDNGSQIKANSDFEIDVTINSSKGDWVKAELLLYKTKAGSGQFQLKEISIPVDGKKHTIRWSLPESDDWLQNYRWFRLVLNSNGINVTLSKPRLIRRVVRGKLYNLIQKTIYPNSNYNIVPWTQSTTFSPYSDVFGQGIDLRFSNYGAGAFIDFGEMKNVYIGYNKLKVTYWPGTCENTGVYLGTNSRDITMLKNGIVSGSLVSKTISLSDIISSINTQKQILASRLSIQAQKTDERCIIHDVTLE